MPKYLARMRHFMLTIKQPTNSLNNLYSR